MVPSRTSLSRRRLSIVLFVVFAIAVVMGPGPGLRLINPDPNGPREALFVFGMPIIYVWGIFWYAVQVTVIVTAYLLIWRHDGDAAEETGGAADSGERS